jgi:hypothetical protein
MCCNNYIFFLHILYVCDFTSYWHFGKFHGCIVMCVCACVLQCGVFIQYDVDLYQQDLRKACVEVCVLLQF